MSDSILFRAGEELACPGCGATVCAFYEDASADAPPRQWPALWAGERMGQPGPARRIDCPACGASPVHYPVAPVSRYRLRNIRELCGLGEPVVFFVRSGEWTGWRSLNGE